MIPCTEFCVYQREGVCELDSAASGENGNARCGYMVARRQGGADDRLHMTDHK